MMDLFVTGIAITRRRYQRQVVSDTLYLRYKFFSKYFFNGLFEIGDDIADVLDACTYAHLVGTYARYQLFFRAQLFVRGRSGMDDQCLRIAYIGEVTGQFKRIDQLACFLLATLDAKVEDATKSMLQDISLPVYDRDCSLGRDILRTPPADVFRAR